MKVVKRFSDNAFPESYQSDKLSYYRTMHNFLCYSEVKNLTEVCDALTKAKHSASEIFVLGNGSNTLFARKNISSFIIKNSLPKEIKSLGDDVYCVSSSSLVKTVLDFCYKQELDSFYYLSSVPATIGGAVAMNAGRGRKYGCSIMDFVSKVNYLDKDGVFKSVDVSMMNAGYRYTDFLKGFKGFIASVEFRFPPMNKSVNKKNPIKERIEWASMYLDSRPGSCGSVFKVADFRILRVVRGMRLFGAEFSRITINWIVNSSNSSFGVLACICVIKFLHFMLLKRSALEIRVVW